MDSFPDLERKIVAGLLKAWFLPLFLQRTRAASGNHSGGCQVAMLDGSASFINGNARRARRRSQIDSFGSVALSRARDCRVFKWLGRI